MLVKNMKESTFQTLKEEDQREQKVHEMIEKLEEMQRELSQIYPDSLEMQMQKLQINTNTLEMKHREPIEEEIKASCLTKEEMLENAERERERQKLQEPQKHGFFMDEETLRKTYPDDKMERSHLDRAAMFLRLKKLEQQFAEKLIGIHTSKMEMQNMSDAGSSSSKDGMQMKMQQMQMDEILQKSLKQLESLSQEIEMKEQEQMLEKIKTKFRALYDNRRLGIDAEDVRLCALESENIMPPRQRYFKLIVDGRFPYVLLPPNQE